MELTKEQQQGYDLIELRIVNQRYIELLDDLEVKKSPFANKQLNAQLKGVYGVIDKETKKYNSMFEVCAEGTTAFYNATCDIARWIMTKSLFDKALFAQYQIAHDLDYKSVEGIINKVIKRGRK